jgi:MFS family permease
VTQPSVAAVDTRQGWYRGISPESWRAFTAATAGWALDGYENYALILVAPMALSQLLPPPLRAGWVRYQGILLALTLIGWATGGVAWGVVTDYFGRKRAMVVSILMYALFTGLSAAAWSFQSLAFLRFLTGLGIGAEWCTGAALVAEKWPERARSKGGGMMQAGFGVGFFIASAVWLPVQGLGPFAWRLMFLLGILPALLLLYVRTRFDEPERWEQVAAQRRQAHEKRRAGRSLSGAEHALTRSTLADVLSGELLRPTLVTFLLVLMFNIGFWAVSTWIPVFAGGLAKAAHLAAPAVFGTRAAMLYNLGTVAGYVCVPFLADALGRKLTWAFYLACSLAMNAVVFLGHLAPGPFLLACFVNGFFTTGQAGMFAVYLPEVYPTRARATGIAFVFNLGRYLSALGPLYAGALILGLGGIPHMAMTLSLAYLLGCLLVPLLSETRGRPLPA